MPDQPLVVDRASSAVRLSDQQVAEWAGDKRVFISSVMDGLGEERRAVADAVRELGGDPVWFEEFGGRDQDPEQAYLSEVDSSHVHVGILGSRYGRQDRDTGFSATHAESGVDADAVVTSWLTYGEIGNSAMMVTSQGTAVHFRALTDDGRG